MSAINSETGDRGLDALHRAQQAHEPSMEEILASIRNIIADDPAKTAPAQPPQAAPAPMPHIVASKDAAPYGDGFELSQRPDEHAPTVVWRRPQAVEAEASAPAADAVRRNEEPLLSPEADEAVALSFGALTANLEVRGAKLADSVVRDMLRPMLKQWLDENLPAVVERLVREEIQRVARGRK
jgi:uncharacterized protein